MGPIDIRLEGRAASARTLAAACVALALASGPGGVAPLRAQEPEAASVDRQPAVELLAPRGRARAEVVGFTSFVVHDPARARDPGASGSDGAARTGFRPIRLALWYPAARRTSALLTAADYRRLDDPERALADWSPGEILAFEDSLVGASRADGEDEAAARARVDAEAGAVWEAPPAEGRSPLVLYLPDAGESLAATAEAFERLARRGAIVAALPPRGRAPDLEAGDEIALESRARDAAFALGFLLAERGGSIGGVALIGRGRGASAAAAVATRRPEVEALVLLGGSPAAVEALPDWDPIRWTAATLAIGPGGLYDAAVFAPRVRVRGVGSPARLEGTVVEAIADFLEARVEPRVEGASDPRGTTRSAGLEPPPDVPALARLYRDGRGAEAEAAILAARRADPGAYRPATLAALGEILLADDPALAVPALDLAARIHPHSERLGRLLALARERAPSLEEAAPADSVTGGR